MALFESNAWWLVGALVWLLIGIRVFRSQPAIHRKMREMGPAHSGLALVLMVVAILLWPLTLVVTTIFGKGD